MKLIKTLPALSAIALLAGCASQQSDDITGSEGGQAKASCCGEKSEAKSCCDGAKVEKADGKGADGTPLQKN
jgi:hypothetical protein